MEISSIKAKPEINVQSEDVKVEAPKPKATEPAPVAKRGMDFMLVYRISPNLKTVSVSYEVSPARFLNSVA